jgi:hypothetical protein
MVRRRELKAKLRSSLASRSDPKRQRPPAAYRTGIAVPFYGKRDSATKDSESGGPNPKRRQKMIVLIEIYRAV